MTFGRTRQRYLCGGYAERNPTWDIEDSPWKAEHVYSFFVQHGITPRSVAEIGCGAGGVLVNLRQRLPGTEFYGFDIAPAAARFWRELGTERIEFTLGDFFEANRRVYDVILLLDVVEHLENPFKFLSRLRPYASQFVFHFPLDLSALSVLREWPLLRVRDTVGHIHYFTKGLVLALLHECGYEIMDWQYTRAAFTGPQRSWKTRVAALARRAAYLLNKDIGVRLLGGETLIVLARPLSGT